MEEINIKEFFIYLKRYIFGFIAAVILAIAIVLIYDLTIKTPIYQAKTTIVVAKSDGAENTAATLNDVNISQKLTSTYSEIAKSELVLSRVISELELNTNVKDLSKNVSVSPVGDTSIISVAVKDLSAEEAAKITNKIAEVFADEVMKIYKLDNVSQLSNAKTPEAPANNTLMRDLALAVGAAIGGVVAFAFLRFCLDDTVKHNDNIEQMLGMAATGAISENENNSKRKTHELVVEYAPKSVVSENVKSLRTNLQFTAIDKNLKTILVTSTNAGEGKSFVSSNLAVSFAKADKKVLLIDCDLRRGRIHKVFNLPNIGGLSDLLAESLENTYKYIRPTAIKNLSVITCGTYPPNPSELLASQKNRRLIQALKAYYDIIIFDGAPAGGLADSVILASLMDETLLVVKDGATARGDLVAVKESLSKVGAKVAGVVFNMVKHHSSHYYYNYYYGEQGEKEKGKKQDD